MRTRFFAAAALGAVLLLAGCGNDDDPADAAPDPTEASDATDGSADRDPNNDLRDADEVLQEAERDGAEDAEIGQPAKLGDVTVTVSDIALESAEGAPGTDDEAILRVQLRAENHGDEQVEGVEVAVLCADGAEGGWYADSTFDMYEPLPPGTFREGVLELGVPIGCEDPVVRAESYVAVVYDDVEPPAAIWAVPDGVLP